MCNEIKRWKLYENYTNINDSHSSFLTSFTHFLNIFTQKFFLSFEKVRNFVKCSFWKNLFSNGSLRGESHIDFRWRCRMMTLAGGGLLLRTYWKWEKVLNFKVNKLSFATKFIVVSCYSPSVQVKCQS